MTKKSFSHHRDKPNGFRLNFQNGNSISTIWNPGTYSDNYDLPYEKMNEPLDSDTVEVQVTCPELMVEFFELKFPEKCQGGNIFERLTLSQWMEMISILAKDYK